MSYRSDEGVAVERVEATDAAYARRAQNLISRYQDDVGRDAGDTPGLLLAWLADIRVQWSTATWRQYRASLAAWYDSQGKPAMANAIRAIDTSACRSRTALPIRRRRTSARKDKKLGESDRAILQSALAASGSRYAALTWLFLEAGRLAGLRPGEWPDAFWHPQDEAIDAVPRAGALRLVVHNAKATNGRAHGPYRTLHLDNLPPHEIATVARMIRTAHDQGADWSNAYAQCRKLLFRVARRCWSSRDRYPTLYSGRHQFAADAKAAGCTEIEVAALMGHRNDRVAQVHYGRRRVGRTGGFQVRADPGDVARVAAAQGLNADPAPTPQSGSRPSSGPSMG